MGEKQPQGSGAAPGRLRAEKLFGRLAKLNQALLEGRRDVSTFDGSLEFFNQGNGVGGQSLDLRSASILIAKSKRSLV